MARFPLAGKYLFDAISMLDHSHLYGHKAATKIETTEYVRSSHVRYVADSYGTIWKAATPE